MLARAHRAPRKLRLNLRKIKLHADGLMTLSLVLTEGEFWVDSGKRRGFVLSAGGVRSTLRFSVARETSEGARGVEGRAAKNAAKL